MIDYGKVTLNVDALLRKKEMSKTQLSYRAEISHTQINRFCRNEVSRIDLNTLARLCLVLECDISDLLKYEPPSAHTQVNNDLSL